MTFYWPTVVMGANESHHVRGVSEGLVVFPRLAERRRPNVDHATVDAELASSLVQSSNLECRVHSAGSEATCDRSNGSPCRHGPEPGSLRKTQFPPGARFNA